VITVGIEEQYLDQRGRAAERKYERQVAASLKRKAKSLATLKAKKRRGIEFLMASAGASGSQGRVPGSVGEPHERNTVCGTLLTHSENEGGYCHNLQSPKLDNLSRTSTQSRLKMEARDGGKWRLLGSQVALVTLERTGRTAGAKYMFESRYAKRRLKGFAKAVNATLAGVVAWWRFEVSHDHANPGREAFVHAHAIIPLEAVGQLNHAAASDVGLTIHVERMPLPAAVAYLSKPQIDPAILEAATYAKCWKGLPLSQWNKTADAKYTEVEPQLPKPDVWRPDYRKFEKSVKRDNIVWAILNAIRERRPYWIETDNEVDWRLLEVKHALGMLETPDVKAFETQILEWRREAFAKVKPSLKTAITSRPSVRGFPFMLQVCGVASRVVQQVLRDSVPWFSFSRLFGGFRTVLESS
jgi:hypothetical protein